MTLFEKLATTTDEKGELLIALATRDVDSSIADAFLVHYLLSLCDHTE